MNARTRIAVFSFVTLFVSLALPLSAAAHYGPTDTQADWPKPAHIFPNYYVDPDQGIRYTFYLDENIDRLPHLMRRMDVSGGLYPTFLDLGTFCPSSSQDAADLLGGSAENWYYLAYDGSWRFTAPNPVKLTLQLGSFLDLSGPQPAHGPVGTVHRSNYWHKFASTFGYFYCSRQAAGTKGD